MSPPSEYKILPLPYSLTLLLTLPMRTHLMLLLSVMMIGWTIPCSHSYNDNFYMENNIGPMRSNAVLKDYDGSDSPLFAVLKEEYEPEDGLREESSRMKRGGKFRKTDGKIRLLKIML